jgi:hypothetical protein
LIKLKSKMITVNSQGVEVRNSIGKKKSVRKVERAGFEQYSSISTAVLLRKLLLQLRSWIQLPSGPFLLFVTYGIMELSLWSCLNRRDLDKKSSIKICYLFGIAYSTYYMSS